MTRVFSLMALGALAVGLTLATPAPSQAQTRYGVHGDVGRTYFGNGFYHAPIYYNPYSVEGIRAYHDSFRYGIQAHYDSFRRPAPVVIPEYYHWTPGRGYHSHGEVLIPHRGHYHVRRY